MPNFNVMNILYTNFKIAHQNLSFGEHVTPIGRVSEWHIGEGLPYMDGRRQIKYLTRTNMYAASVLIVRGQVIDLKKIYFYG